MPEDPKIQEIRERVSKLKLQQLAEEISRLEYEKLRLEKEKELKLNKVKAQLSIIPAAVQAKHPVLGYIANKIGTNAVEAAKNLGQGAVILGKAGYGFAKKQYEEGEARRKYLEAHPRIAKQVREEEERNNPLNRLGIASTPQRAYKVQRDNYTPYFDRIAKANPPYSPTVIDRLVGYKGRKSKGKKMVEA